MTPDAHATALGLAACYTFWRWLKKPTWGQTALAGVVLGLAELAKTTLILFYPLWPLIWLVYRAADRRNTPRYQEVGMLVLLMAIGLYVLNLGYTFEDSFTKLKDFCFVSDLFTGTDVNLQTEIGNPQSINRFANTWLGQLPLPFPKNYLLGIDLQQKDNEHYGQPSYLHGEWRNHGWWYYYLYAFTIKVPLALLILGLLAIVVRLFWIEIPRPTVGRLGEGLSTPVWPDEMALLSPGLLILTVVSLNTGFNEHMRYALPAFPYFFIYVSQVAKLLSAPPDTSYLLRLDNRLIATSPTDYRRVALCFPSIVLLRFLPQSLVVFLSSWLIASSLWSYPHSLSYFNETVGGPLNGPKYLLGSNVDWGQDLRYLKWWTDREKRNTSGDTLFLAYAGLFSPADVGFGGASAFDIK